MDKGYLTQKGTLMLRKIISSAKYFRKGIAAVIGGLAVIAATGTLHGTALVAVNAVVAAATAAGVITAKNAEAVPAQPKQPAPTP